MTHHRSPTPAVSRRTLIRGTAAIGMAGLGLATAGPAAAQSGGEPVYNGWFDTVDNYEGTVDERGSDQVTITVGASGNGGAFAFGPAAVHVDPGTTVVWEWTGNGGSHNVVAEDGSFESELVGEGGHTFEYTVEGEGIITYACTPHKTVGMKGAIAVGDVEMATAETASDTEREQESGEEIDYGGWFEGVNNFDRTVDETGTDEVRITVGAEGNNGPYAFDPPAVRVDPGTTVIWEWSGNGGSHNVVAEDGSFESELTGGSGTTFEQTVEERGIAKYVCTPHESMGMRGAVVVGSPESDGGYSRGDLLTLGGGVGLAGGLVALFGFGTSTRDSGSTD